MGKREVNFIAVGSTVLIELGTIVSKSGLVLPDQAKNVLESDRAFRVISIGEQALSFLSDNIKEGVFVYLKPYADPSLIIEENNLRYAIIEASNISGYAPDGYDLEVHLKRKEEQKEEVKRKIKEAHKKAHMEVRGES